MIPVTLQTLAQFAAGTLRGDGTCLVTNVNTDSRKITAGEVFVALVGDRFDAHDFIHLVHDGLLDGREVAAFDLGLGARAAKKIFHQGENQARIHHEQGVAAQGLHLENGDAGGHGKRAHEVAELAHVNLFCICISIA